MSEPFKLRSQGSSFKMIGSSSPMKVCGPGDTKCGLNNRKVDKPGTVVSRNLDKVGNWLKNITSKPKKKKTNYGNVKKSKTTSHLVRGRTSYN